MHKNISYADTGKRGLLDVYTPAGGDPRGAPVLLQVHGGAWTIGNKDQQGIPLMQHLAAKGWVCVAINYRLSPRDPFPAHVIDVKRAIAWIRENIEEYGGDPDYIAITGGSAGGHLTALTALTANDPAWQPGFEDVDTTVQVAVPHYGVYDFAGSTGLRSAELMRDTFLASRVLQKTWEDDPEAFEDASPILRITPEAPDFFVLHGAQTPWSTSTRPDCSWPSCARSPSARSSTPSCREHNTPSTSSRRSAVRTSCARSTATCTGTGTSTDASTPPSPSGATRGSAHRRRCAGSGWCHPRWTGSGC